jgi:hypothetical protein
MNGGTKRTALVTAALVGALITSHCTTGRLSRLPAL